MGYIQYKELPYRHTKAHGGACSLITLANIFNNDTYLSVENLNKANRDSFAGMTTAEEILLVNEVENLILEPLLVSQEKVSLGFLYDWLSDKPKNSEVYCYYVSTLRSVPNETPTGEIPKVVGHKFAILVLLGSILVINGNYSHSYEIETVEDLISREGEIHSISVFFELNRKRKVFTAFDLKHLL